MDHRKVIQKEKGRTKEKAKEKAVRMVREKERTKGRVPIDRKVKEKVKAPAGSRQEVVKRTKIWFAIAVERKAIRPSSVLRRTRIRTRFVSVVERRVMFEQTAV